MSNWKPYFGALLITSFFFSSFFLFSKSANGQIDTTGPVISNISVSTSSSSSTITWTTDENSDSFVIYDPTTEDFGFSKNNSALVTSHSITLDQLLADTTYYYYVRSTDAFGNITLSAASTLKTAKADSTVTSQPATNTTSTPIVKKDTSPPTIFMSTNFSKPLKESPLISGNASDDISVSKIEYSVDGGKNWLSVKITPAAKVSFSFKPIALEDGNYNLIVKGTDSSGKTGQDSDTLVIDKLPPAIGGNNIFLGPQNLFPGFDGTITVVEGSEATVAVNSVGGPISVDFEIAGNKYPFSQIEGTNIWKGKVKFEKVGNYDLVVNSIDGADNKTQRKINAVNVLSSGEIKGASLDEGGTLNNAIVTVYVYSQGLGNWSVWDGASFGQKNPQLVSDGSYGFLIPKGKYYLQAQAPGYRTATSQIFEVNESSVINTDLTLTPHPRFTIFGKTFTVPSQLDFGETLTPFDIQVKGQSDASGKSVLIGTKVPDVEIKTTESSTIRLSDLRGKKTILTFLLLTTWSPVSQEQLSILDRLAAKGFNTYPIFMMESENVVKSFLRRGGYTVKAGVDPDGVLLKNFPITSLPQHFVLDEEGIIREVIVGSKSQTELRKILENIQ